VWGAERHLVGATDGTDAVGMVVDKRGDATNVALSSGSNGANMSRIMARMTSAMKMKTAEWHALLPVVERRLGRQHNVLHCGLNVMVVVLRGSSIANTVVGASGSGKARVESSGWLVTSSGCSLVVVVVSTATMAGPLDGACRGGRT
jgi:hypothetical protein